MFVVQEDQCGCDGATEAPRVAAVAAEGLVGGLEQRVGAFAEAAQRTGEGVVGLLVGVSCPSLGFLNGIVKVSVSPS